MPGLAKPREGKPLEIEFSLWPTRRSASRFELNHRVYMSDPWPFLADHIQHAPLNRTGKEDALHYLSQAEDYYRAATSANIEAAKPVLIYYSFENLAKSALLCWNPELDFSKNTVHGLHVWKDYKSKEDCLAAYPTGNTPNGYRVSVFHELLKFYGKSGLIPEGGRKYPLSRMTPQILMGHRMWSTARGTTDRFVRVEKVLLMQESNDKKTWLRLELKQANLRSCQLSDEELLSRTRLKEDEWHQLPSAKDEAQDNCHLITLEQSKTKPYFSGPDEKLQELADSIKPRLWQAAIRSHPHREYYLYAAPDNEHGELLPQLASIYALAYYLSDLTRYHPSAYLSLIRGAYGPFYVGLLQDSPKQFLYLFASEMMQREVSCGDHI